MKVQSKEIASGASLGADWTSEWVPLENVWAFSVQAIATGSPVGAFKLQASSDSKGPNAREPWASPVNAIDIAGSTASISGADEIIWNVTEVAYSWVRVVYTRTSGTGSLTARVGVKGV
jgi:hypothetical protein